MACSAGFCLSSMACRDSLAKHEISTALEFRQAALPHSQSQAKGRRRQALVSHASHEESSSSQNDMVSSGGKSPAMSRRALVALFGIFSQASNFSQARADGMTPTNESEQIRQEMIQKIEARLTNPSTIFPNLPAFSGETKSSASNVDSKQTSSSDLMFLGSEPVSSENGLQILPQNEGSDGSSSGYLNSLGYLGSGVLGGLYWLERQAKESSASALGESSSKLKAKEDAMVALTEQLEGKLSQEKELASRQYKKSQEEQEFLSSELSSATKLADNLQMELGDQKGIVQSLQSQIKDLEAAMLDAGKEKASLEETLFREQTAGKKLEDELRVLNLEVDSKELEISNMRSVIQDKEKALELASSRLSEKVEALSNARRTIEDLEKEMILINENLSLNETLVQDLTSKLAAANAHEEETQRQLATVYQELDSVKQSSALELQAVQDNLTFKVAEVEALTLKLNTASKESERMKIATNDLQKEMHILRQSVIEGNGAIEQLTGELDASLQELKAAKAHLDSLTEDLNNEKESNRMLDRRIVDARHEAELNLTSFKQAVDHERSLSNKLNEELKKVILDLDLSKKEAISLNEQFKKLQVSFEQVKKDFTESEEAVKITGLALTREKEIAAENKKQLELARRAIAETKENVKFLRRDIEKANMEADKMNKEIKELRKELEIATAKISTLETDKGSLNDLLEEEKAFSNNMKEKVRQVDTVLGKLSKEKETTTKRAKKLEGELASTKGEVLRMKKQVTTLDAALEEAKSRVQILTENSRSPEQSSSAAQISTEIHSVQAELSHMHKSLEDAGRIQAEADAAIESLQDVMSQSGSAENTVLVSPQLKHDREL